MITIANSNPVAATLEPYFKKLPALPASIVDILFTFTPWLALIFGILGIIGSLSAFSAFSFLTPFAFMGGASSNYGSSMMSTVGWLISSVLMVMAFPGLRAGKLNGWNLLFWSSVVSAVFSLLTISLGTIIGEIIGFYILFQVKPRYHS